MRTILVTIALVALSSTAANAACRSPGTYPGTVSKRGTDFRSFTLFRGPTLITLVTNEASDRLSFVVRRPSGRIICDKGPASQLTCRPDVIGRTEGVYRIQVYNRLHRSVPYQLICSDL